MPETQEARLTTIHHGDCIETMNAMPPESVDAIVTDPPYGLSFMQAKWDATPPGVQWAEACYRVLKPGGHIVAFGGTRTWHRLAVAIEDAGFEMRDSLAWLYGSGFPKSMNVSKAIDKAAGAEGTYGEPKSERHAGIVKLGRRHGPNTEKGWLRPSDSDPEAIRKQALTYTGATDTSQRWDGWGTALKPAFEPIVLARKPLAEKTVARNVLAHGTGAINVDACRNAPADGDYDHQGNDNHTPTRSIYEGGTGDTGRQRPPHPAGRWPANVLLDQHAAAWVDEQSGNVKGAASNGNKAGNGYHGNFGVVPQSPGYADSGGASRFFYTAKAPKSERPNVDGVQHPTVKPLAIMRWLIRLVTPPGGTVLDPFAGSGTTIEAALIEGFDPVGIEMETDYLPLIQHRIDRIKQPKEHA